MSYCRLLLTPRMTLLIVIGSLIYSVGLNQFIVPVGLYNGGFLGIAQLIRHFMESWFGISFGNTNIAGILYLFAFSNKLLPDSRTDTVSEDGILYFILNIPLLAVSVKRFGKEFLAKTIYCVCWYSLFLTVVPIADHLLVDEHLTACVAGGVICGIGAGMTLLSGGSGGGEEILGLLLMQKHSNLSVGKVSAMLNIFIFGTCAVIFSISQAIYSVLFTGIVYYVLDKVHFQNIMLTMLIITKKQGLEKIIFEKVNRGVTKWNAYGAYRNEEREILMTVVSKSEFLQLRRLLLAADPEVFIIIEENVFVVGNFQKRVNQ